MNTQIKKTQTYLPMILATMITGVSAVSAVASEAIHSVKDPQVIYQSQSANHSIYGYPNTLLGKVSLKPELVYVNQAYGPSIYSYVHSGSETTVPWNVEYVDTAYGQAIYSYESAWAQGSVKLLPIVIY